MMERLIAVSSILIENRNYEPGDELPTHDAGVVGAWLENGAAVWKGGEVPEGQAVKAKQATAPAGLPGAACPSAGPEQDLVGKPPSRRVRGARPEPEKGRRKSSA